MAIAGNLRTMQLADLLQWIANGHYTGTLLVTGPGVEKSLYFRDGSIISCASTNPKEFLGHFLVSQGVISEDELVAAVSEQDRHRELLGKILVSQGAITQQDLERMLAAKAVESIYELFLWTEGQFKFVDKELPEQELVPVSLDVTHLVLEGTRRFDEWQRIHERIPSLGCVPVAVADLLDGEADEARRAVLAQVNDDRTIEEICLETHSTEFFVCEILFQKVQQGLLKVVRPRTEHGGGETTETTAEALIADARRHLEEQDYEQALRRLRAARSLEPDDPEVARAVREGETEIRAFLESDGIDKAGVPVLSSPLATLSSLPLSPAAGFMLSRINGTSDLASILKISPLQEIDALLVVWKLVRDGHVRLKFG